MKERSEFWLRYGFALIIITLVLRLFEAWQIGNTFSALIADSFIGYPHMHVFFGIGLTAFLYGCALENMYAR